MNKDTSKLLSYMSMAKKIVCNHSGSCEKCPFKMQSKEQIVCQIDVLGFLLIKYIDSGSEGHPL